MKLERKSLLRLRRTALAFGAMSLTLPAFSCAADGEVRDDHVGVVTHFGQGWSVSKYMPVVANLGVGWIRDDIGWGDVEPKPHDYRISPRLAAWLEGAHAQHLKVLLILNYGNRAYADPFSPDDYARAAVFLATRLKDRIAALEVLNEPNNGDFQKAYGGAWNGHEGDGSVSPYVRAYAKVLAATVAAVKKANPALLVVGYGAPPPATFRMIALGPPPGLDGITDHPYSDKARLPELIPYAATPGLLQRDGIATADVDGTYASQCAFFRKFAGEHGLHAALWNTEWGFSTSDTPGDPLENLTPPGQAVYVLRRLLEMRALDVKGFYYALKDEGTHRDVRFENFGLLDVRDAPKPAYGAFQHFAATFAKLEGDGTAGGFVLDAPPTGNHGSRCYAYRAATGAEKWIACWNVVPWTADETPPTAHLLLPPGAAWTRATLSDLRTGAQKPLDFLEDAQGRAFLTVPFGANPAVVHLFN